MRALSSDIAVVRPTIIGLQAVRLLHRPLSKSTFTFPLKYFFNLYVIAILTLRLKPAYSRGKENPCTNTSL